MAKKKQEPEKAPNHERWLLTYADLITLLLIFFIVMYTISSVNAQKFQQVAESLTSAFGVTKGGDSMIPGNSNPSILPGQSGAFMPPGGEGKTEEEMNFEEIEEKIESLAKEKGLETSLTVRQEERGIAVELNEAALFELGSAELGPIAIENIINVGKIILESAPENHIRVEGYTDNIPINTAQYPSNWELSSARANSVRKILQDSVGMKPERLSIIGYGEYKPAVPNDTPENRRKNRRVVIAIIKAEYNVLEPGNPDNSIIPKITTPLSATQ